MGFECHFFTQRPVVIWPIGVFDCRVSADRPVRWRSGGDSSLHKEQLWALGANWWEDVLDACRWSAASPRLYELSKLAHSNESSVDDSRRVMIIPVPHRGQCHGEMLSGGGSRAWG